MRTTAPPRIELRRETPARILHLARPIPGPSLSELLVSFQAAELPAPGRSVAEKARSIMGIGRGRWWLVEEKPVQPHDSPPTTTTSFGIAIDIGDACERFRISGECVLDLLSKGSALDLDRRAFANGACALSSVLRKIWWGGAAGVSVSGSDSHLCPFYCGHFKDEFFKISVV